MVGGTARKLWFSEGSPFARKVRIVLAEKGLDYEKDVLNGIRPDLDINLICPVIYAAKRKIIGPQARPNLKSHIARFCGRPSVASTPVSEFGGRVIEHA